MQKSQKSKKFAHNAPHVLLGRTLTGTAGQGRIEKMRTLGHHVSHVCPMPVRSGLGTVRGLLTCFTKNRTRLKIMAEQGVIGHRQRLRERFAHGEQGSDSEEALLELLLTYAIPQKDVLPLARRLLAEFGDLASCLQAPRERLCKTDGIKEYSALLVKLVERIGRKTSKSQGSASPQGRVIAKALPASFVVPPLPRERGLKNPVSTRPTRIMAQPEAPGSSAPLFGKALVGESVRVLPLLPDTESLPKMRAFLHATLRHNSELTRQRNANYILRGMFGQGQAVRPLLQFARAFAATQALREVCFYRFLRSHPLEVELVQALLLPNIARAWNGRWRYEI